MLDRLFSKTLSLVINGEEISFHTLAEFEFALGGRTNVPASKLAELIVLSPDELKREAKSIKAVEKRFVDILSRSITQPGEIGRLVREIDTQVFSNDYDWRSIFKALNNEDESFDELRRVGLVKYMQYLRSRQDVIKQTYRVKLKESDPPGESGRDPQPAREETKDPFRETSIFDSVSLPAPLALVPSTVLTRLPKGEAVSIKPRAAGEFDLRLSKHPFVLRTGAQCELVDELGNVHRVAPGKNIIGRDAVCNIVVDNSLRDVSRMHLIIEPMDGGVLRFTDLSSHGTFLPTNLLPHTEN